MRVWLAATSNSRSQLCRDLPDPDRPTKDEIYKVCRGLIDYMDGDVESAIQEAKSCDTPVGDTGDIGVRREILSLKTHLHLCFREYFHPCT